MAYNMSFMNTSNNILDIVNGVNIASNGFVGLMFLVVLWIGLFAAFKQFDTMKNMIVTSFIVIIVSSLMFFAGMIAWWIVMIFIIIFITSMMVNFFT